MAIPCTFADILPITQTSSHTYTFNFTEDWCTGSVPSGGYVASALMIAARTHMQLTHTARSQPDVINIHVEYLRRTSVGPATVTVQDVKLGSRISNLHLVLSQQATESSEPTHTLRSKPQWRQQDEVHASVMMSSIPDETGTTHHTGYKPSPPCLPVDLPALAANQDRNYILRRADAFASYRRSASNVQMFFVRPEARRGPDHSPARVDLWARLTPTTQPSRQAGRWTNDALGFLVDIFTAVNERYVNAQVEDALLREDATDAEIAELMHKSDLGSGPAPFWYPTLSLNLDVKKRLPELAAAAADDSGGGGGVVMLFVRVQAKKILNGRMDLSVEVWDEAGDLVALSSHASLIMDASRNMTRGKKAYNGSGSKM